MSVSVVGTPYLFHLRDSYEKLENMIRGYVFVVYIDPFFLQIQPWRKIVVPAPLPLEWIEGVEAASLRPNNS